MLYTQRNDCRLCGGNLTDVLDLGEIYISTFLDEGEKLPQKAPIDLVVCDDCKLFQLRHTVGSDVMYGQYWYQSGLNDSMVKALRDVVATVYGRVKLQPGDIVVDIGANDGTLLSNYDSSVTRVAFEPSNLAELGLKHSSVVINDFFNQKSFSHFFGEKKAKAITAIAMFYDLEDPHTFVQDLKDILSDDGMIVIQMMDIKSMFEKNDFPNLCHEHLEYYSLEVLCKLMEEHGLEVFDVVYNGVNGGSLRAYIGHTSECNKDTVKIALQEESRFFKSLGNPGEYFKNKIEQVREKVCTFINEQKIDGYQFAVMGASTKGNTILQYFGLSSKEINHAAEVNPDKFGKRTVGSNIPIISQSYSLAQHPDYYLILPWGFIDNFVEKNLDYLSQGGTFLVPLPEPRLIGYTPSAGVEEWLL